MYQKTNDSSSVEEQFNGLLNEQLELVHNRMLNTFDERVGPFENRFVLFGAGGLGRKTLAGLRQIGVSPLAFADSNSAIWNTSIDGVQVLSPGDAARKFGKNSTFITTIWRGGSSERQSDRQKQLQDLGCSNVIPFGYLFWKYPNIFFPHAYLESPVDLLQHSEELKTLFRLWADEASRYEYLAQLKFRLKLDFDALTFPASHAQYFPDDLFTLLRGEVFVDCGAFDGDTIREFLLRNESFAGRIFAFEPDKINFRKLNDYVLSLPMSMQKKILLEQAPVGTCGQKVRFSSTGTVSSTASENGEMEMDCVCLDRALMGFGPSFIKMDIESAEIDALNGAREVVQKFRPILAVCIYHKPDHLWKIPLLISSLQEDYHLFLRSHDGEGWELVCYAVPEERLLTTRK